MLVLGVSPKIQRATGGRSLKPEQGQVAFARQHGGSIFIWGTPALNLGKPDDALASYRKVLEIDPDNAVAHNNLGNVYFNLGQFDEARRLAIAGQLSCSLILQLSTAIWAAS